MAADRAGTYISGHGILKFLLSLAELLIEEVGIGLDGLGVGRNCGSGFRVGHGERVTRRMLVQTVVMGSEGGNGCTSGGVWLWKGVEGKREVLWDSSGFSIDLLLPQYSVATFTSPEEKKLHQVQISKFLAFSLTRVVVRAQ